MTGDTADDQSPSGASLREDHGWLREAEQELDAGPADDAERTTKVGRVRLVKARRVPGARKRRT